VKRIDRSSVTMQKISVRTLWGGLPPLKRKKKWQTIGAINVSALTTLRNFGRTDQRKMVVIHLD
jgi:hypothetical protein